MQLRDDHQQTDEENGSIAELFFTSLPKKTFKDIYLLSSSLSFAAPNSRDLSEEKDHYVMRCVLVKPNLEINGESVTNAE